MHKSFSIILAVLLVVALAIPCFASESNVADEMYETLLEQMGIPPEVFTEMDYWTLYVVEDTVRFFAGNAPMYVYTGQPDWTTDPNYVRTWLKFDYQDCYYGIWVSKVDGVELTEFTRKVQGGDMYNIGIDQIDEIYTKHDIINIDTGEVVYPAYEREYCDGDTCPATDTEYDNVCDDCGKVLTMSLRSTAYERAKYIAESSTQGYWAIFQLGNEYRVYSSSSRMTSPDGVTLEADNLKYMHVYEKEDGSTGADGWFTGFDVNYSFVEANHTIENFTAPPLEMVIQGVTGEAMKATLPNLHQTMKILTLCGVGCLALWIGLKLFGKRSLLFLKR